MKSVSISDETHTQLLYTQLSLATDNPDRLVTLDDTIRHLIRVWINAQDPLAAQLMVNLARDRRKPAS